MPKRILVLLLLIGACSTPRTWAQSPCSTTSLTSHVICTIPQLYGPAGLSNGGALAPVGDHQGHYESDFQQSLSAVNGAIASELSFLPLSSPSSGLSFVFDKSLGVFVASDASFGPILSERAGTIGRNRFAVGVSYEYFNFNSVDGIGLKNFPVVFLHSDNCTDSPTTCNPTPPTTVINCSVNNGLTSSTGDKRNKGKCGFVRDYIVTQNRIDLKLHQTTIYASFGLTNRIDIAVAIPIVDVAMRASSAATMVPNSMSGLHVFANPDAATCTASVPPPGSPCYSDFFSSARSSTGIGDITIRGKAELIRGEHSGVSAAVDVRAPSGDELNFQGTGTWGTRIFGIWSYSGRFSPHVNAGYEWNGKSILAGDIFSGTKASLPNQFFYSAGVEAAVVKRLTLTFDLVGQRIIDGQKLVRSDATVLGPCDTPALPPFSTACQNPGPAAFVPSVTGVTSSYNMTNAAAGFRFNPFSRLLITANALFKLDEGGMRANVVPLIGVSYTFR